MRPLLFLTAGCAVLLSASGAAAGPGRLVWGPAGASCEPLEGPMCNGDSQCMARGSGVCVGNYCLGPDDVLCSTDGQESGCPGLEPDALPPPYANVYICYPSSFDPEYCFGRSPRDCFTQVGSAALVPYARGDCDDDTIANADEYDETTICSAETRIGVVAPDGSCGRAPPCGRGTFSPACTPDAFCKDERIGDTVGGLCVPEREPLYCCEPNLECPSGSVCVGDPAGVDFGLCSAQDFCPDLAGPAAVPCFRAPMTALFVGSSDGDCDGDGTPNQREVDLGRDPCANDRPDVDAGPQPPPDAGTSVDASRPPVRPNFGGGGGCACRATIGNRAVGGLWALPALLGLLMVRRRTGRTRLAPRASGRI